MTEEMNVVDAQKMLDAFPERSNIATRVEYLEMALKQAKIDELALSNKVNSAVSKTHYATLEAFQKDLKTYNDLLTEYTRLTKIRPQTTDVKKLIAANTNLRKAHNALVKKTTKSSLTIVQLNTKYILPIKKNIEALSDAQTALRTAQTTLSEARAEQDKIQQAERELSEARADLEKCRAQNLVIGDDLKGGDKKYCYPVRINDSGEVQTDCVDEVAKIPQCYTKSTIDTIYDEEGNLSSVNVRSDTGTWELFFCGTPETAYQDPSNPLSNYPTIPGASAQPGTEAAAPMVAGNPNQPSLATPKTTCENLAEGELSSSCHYDQVKCEANGIKWKQSRLVCFVDKIEVVCSVDPECLPDTDGDDNLIHFEGCTDPKAKNYNKLATKDDGSCQYEEDNSCEKQPRATCADYWRQHEYCINGDSENESLAGGYKLWDCAVYDDNEKECSRASCSYDTRNGN
jgi:hypothetical protein